MCPCAIGFASVIYSHPAFGPALPLLTKLVFLSSVVHQLAICALSPLPFAIAQVQDAGVLFLSSMATAIMTSLGPETPLHERLATVVVHLSLSTALVGIGLIVIGRMRLASLVQYLPSPVIGGYLAFMGFFMIRGGLSLSSGVQLAVLSDWKLLITGEKMLLLTPGLIAGLLLSLLTSKLPKYFSILFPVSLVVMPLVFYIALWVSGSSSDDARNTGFLLSSLTSSGPTSVLDAYKLFDLRAVHWSAMFPSQLVTLASMLAMIAFGSSLDIASISTATSSVVDYNQQLQNVGAANVASGLAGGLSGSFIFSQTLISHHLRPVSEDRMSLARLSGLSLAACELAIVALPFPLMTVLPKFLFSAVMIFIGAELLKSWLGPDAYRKLLFGEYLTALGTFCCLNALGVQLGLAAGVALAALSFLVEYARAQTVNVVHKTSNVIRNAEQHRLLYSSDTTGAKLAKQQAVVTIELHGHIFFGSATRIHDLVKSAVVVPSWSNKARNARSRAHSAATTIASSSFTHSLSVKSLEAECLPLLHHDSNQLAYQTVETSSSLETLDGVPAEEVDRMIATRFIVFNFADVSGVDATATRACFLALKVLLDRFKVCVLYCGMRPRIERLLRVNGVLPPEDADSLCTYDEAFKYCRVTTDLDLALDWCEQQLIMDAARDNRSRSDDWETQLTSGILASESPLSLPRILRAYLDKSGVDIRATVDDLAEHFQLTLFQSNDHVFSLDETADAWFVLLRGQVELLTPSPSANLSSNFSKGELVGRVRPGCLFGDMDFVLRQPRIVVAVVTADNSLVARMPRVRMQNLPPNLALVLHQVLLRASVMTVNEKLHALAI